MRKLASMALLMGLVAWPLQFALAQEGEGEGEKAGAEGGEAAAPADDKDPWKAPKTAEDKPAEDKPADATAAADNSIVVAPETYPKAELNRPLVLRPLVLEPRFWFIFDGMFAEPAGSSVPNWVALKLGAGFGIIDNLEAGISFPLGLSPNVRGGPFEIYGAYELSSLIGVQDMWLGVDLDMNIRTSKTYNLGYTWGRHFNMTLGVPFKYKFHEMVGVTAKLDLGFAAKPGAFLLGLQVGGMLQPIDWVVIELLFGLDGWMGDNSFLLVPLSVRSAFTPIADLDIFVELGFPDLNYKKHLGAFWLQIMAGVAYRFGF